MDFHKQKKKKKKKNTIFPPFKGKMSNICPPFRKYERNNILIKCKIDNIWVFLEFDYVKLKKVRLYTKIDIDFVRANANALRGGQCNFPLFLILYFCVSLYVIHISL